MKKLEFDNYSLLKMPKKGFTAPVIYIGIFLIIFGILIYSFYKKSKAEQLTEVKILTDRIVTNIGLKLNGNLDFIKLIARERSDGNITEQTFPSHVKQYLLDHPEFINITWVDSNFVIKTVYPLVGNSHIIGLHLELPEPKKAAYLAKSSKEYVYTKPFGAIQGNPSFEVWVPVFKDKKFTGLVAGVYSCSNLLKQSIPVIKKHKTNFKIVNEDDVILADFSEFDISQNDLYYQSTIKSLNNGMKVVIQMQKAQPFTLFMGILVIFSIILLIGFSYSLWKIKREMKVRHEIQEKLRARENELKMQNQEYLSLNEELTESNSRIQNVNHELLTAKEKAEESEEIYRMLFESINDAVFISEPSADGETIKFIKVNDIACQRLGYSEWELLTKSPMDITSEKYKSNIRDFSNLLLTNSHSLIESEQITKNGQVIPVEISTRVTRFKNRIIFHSIARDITERKQNELRIKEKTEEIEAQNEEYLKINEELKQTVERLTDLENRLQFALMSGKLGTWDWNVQTGNIVWSDLCKNIFGISRDVDVNYDYFLNILLPEDKDRINNLVWEALNEKREYNCEYRVKWPDGTLHWIQAMGRGIYNVNQEPVRMIGIVMEITDTKNTELALKHSHNLMKYIIEHNPSSIAVFDKKLRYIYVSESYLKNFQVEQPDVIGKYHYDIFTGLPKKYLDAHQKALRGEVITADEDPYYTVDGSLYWTRWECRPWHEADGSIGGIILYTEVITERIQHKHELIAAKEKAEESDRLKTAFLQNMSHEIRTPMNAIMGFAGLLKDNFNNKRKLEKFSEIIYQRSNDLLDIINDILDIAKIESGQLPVNKEQCNMIELFNELTTFFTEYKERIGKQHINFNLKLSCSQNGANIFTDKGKLKQILINLITNAFKFTENGIIEVGCDKGGDNNLLIYVSDTGIGIPEDKQTIIFERFSQLNQNPKVNIGGTGLGLPIVKGLVKLLGGDISLKSKPGEGSVFSCKLPIH